MTVTADTIREIAATWGLDLRRAGRWYVAYESTRLIACVAPDAAEAKLPAGARALLDPDGDPLGTIDAAKLVRVIGSIDDVTAPCPCGGKLVRRCAACHGRGTVTATCGDCDHKHRCQCLECDGVGESPCEECVAGRVRRPVSETQVAIGPHRYDRYLLAPLVAPLAGAVTVTVGQGGTVTLASGEARVVVARLHTAGHTPCRVPRVRLR